MNVWFQRELTLRPRPRGLHVITSEVRDALPEIGEVRIGLLHVFIRHTSASIHLNENVSPDVRADLERWSRVVAPDESELWRHTAEGPDDMPAHVKAALFGSSLTIPVSSGRLALGTWQGIHLGEHREDGGPRSLVVTLWGERARAG